MLKVVLLLAMLCTYPPFDIKPARVPPPPVDDGPAPEAIPQPVPPPPPPPLPEVEDPILPEPDEKFTEPPPAPEMPAPEVKPQVLPRRRLYLYTATWCGWCVSQKAVVEEFAKKHGLTIGIYTGPPKPNDADILIVDIDKFPSKAGIRSLPAIRVVESEEVGRLVGLQALPAIEDLWQRKRVVGLPAGTVEARVYVDLLLQTLGKGSVELRPGVTVNLSSSVAVTLQRSNDSVAVTFNPPPAVRFTKLGLRYDATLNGMAVTHDKLVLRLGGMPDLTFGVE
jgi:thiol-disulfide isomerase/thioredoxin